ncbi:hypothetical protein Tco_1011060 [Tanacetum coccineum]
MQLIPKQGLLDFAKVWHHLTYLNLTENSGKIQGSHTYYEDATYEQRSETQYRAWEGRPRLSGYVKALQDLKDLKYLLVDQLERLKDAPMELIMASLYLESDSREDAPQWIIDLFPSSSQLKIPIYPEVCDPEDPWTFKEEMLLEDAITANISRAEKKKKRRVICRTHGIGSAHHARSDGIPVFVPTIAPRGLAILLADAATQTEVADKEDDPHSRLQRSISLPPFYNLE